MQDGGNDQPRPDAASSHDDVRARSAERFGRKGSSDTESSEAVDIESSPARLEESGIENVEQSAAASAEPSTDIADDSLELLDAEPEPAATAETENDDLTTKMRPVEAEVRMSDGANYVGKIYIRENERVLDYLNSALPFFALTESSGKVRLLSKTQIMQIVPYDKGDVNAAALHGGGSLM